MSGFFRPLFFFVGCSRRCVTSFRTSSFQAPPPGGLRVVRNSERWEYGMGLAYTSLPLWLSATLQGAGREGQKTEKKKIVGSGVLKLLVLTRNTMLLCRTFLRGLERIRVNYVWAVYRHQVQVVKQHQPGSGHRALLNSRNIRISPTRTAICGSVTWYHFPGRPHRKRKRKRNPRVVHCTSSSTFSSSNHLNGRSRER